MTTTKPKSISIKTNAFGYSGIQSALNLLPVSELKSALIERGIPIPNNRNSMVRLLMAYITNDKPSVRILID